MGTKIVKLKAWIKNQEECIAFSTKELMYARDYNNSMSDKKKKLHEQIGGLSAYLNCYELFYPTTPSATTPDLEYSENLPNQEGHYWMRSKSGFESIKRVVINHMDELCVWITDPRGKDCVVTVERLKNFQWAGPIAHPVK